jgi:oxygen-independent coproporphyrinogen-3 oxidase
VRSQDLGTPSRGGVRYRNTVVPERYLQLEDWPPLLDARGALAARPRERDAHQQVEWLSPETLLSERLMLGLRLLEGIDLLEQERDLGIEVLTPARRRAIEKLVVRKRVHFDGQRLWIPRNAWLFADGTIAELV